MAGTLNGRHLISVADFSAEELRLVLETARTLKGERRRGDRHPLLQGRTLGMIFQKPSLRTRVSFEAGMTQLGGHAIYLAPADIRLGERESTEDIAIVLSRMCDVLMARVFGHKIAEDLARYATIPVINGLSDHEHPCQILADLQTILERKGEVAGLRAVYCGDGNNVAHSLMYGAALLGMHLTVVTPPGYGPEATVLDRARAIAGARCRIEASGDPMDACHGADVIYTDVWTSMGQEAEAEARRQLFAPYQVNRRLLEVADPEAIVLHCLPAHYGQEIEYETARGRNSAIFDQAENRLHAQKALLVLVAG